MVAEILRHHPNVDARDDQGRTAIVLWRGSITTIRIPRSDDKRADHVPTDDPGAVIDLLARAGADLNARDQSGFLAFSFAGFMRSPNPSGRANFLVERKYFYLIE
jgi:hypothetical protein